jgi:hypothetical protein
MINRWKFSLSLTRGVTDVPVVRTWLIIASHLAQIAQYYLPHSRRNPLECFSDSTIPEYRLMLVTLLWLPPAAERTVKLDHRIELVCARARQQQLLIEELLVGDQNLEVVR